MSRAKYHSPEPNTPIFFFGSSSWTIAAEAGMYKKIIGSGVTLLIIFKEEMDDMKTIISLEKYGLLIKGVIKKIKNKEKE